jgi:DNA-directed RNA polymerase specialized sigma subunit
MTFTSSTVVGKEDLYRVGEMAALEALRIYDASSGASRRSFVSKLVRQEMFREAARFCGVFTVDPRTTKMAARANKLHSENWPDKKIAKELSTASRTLDASHIKDLRIAYTYSAVAIFEECGSITRDIDVDVFLESVPMSNEERSICNDRILNNKNAKDVALDLNISISHLYNAEYALKERIKRAVYNHG